MKIKMKTLMVDSEKTVYPEQVIDVTDKEASELIKHGYAIAVEEFPKNITAENNNIPNVEKVKKKKATHEAEKALGGGC